MATDEDDGRAWEGDHHPAVEEFISGDPDELPELESSDFGVDRPDPLFDGERISLTGDEE